jgi:hypothetical protein
VGLSGHGARSGRGPGTSPVRIDPFLVAKDLGGDAASGRPHANARLLVQSNKALDQHHATPV